MTQGDVIRAEAKDIPRIFQVIDCIMQKVWGSSLVGNNLSLKYLQNIGLLCMFKYLYFFNLDTLRWRRRINKTK